MNYHCFSYNYSLQWVLMDAVSSPEPWNPIFWSTLILRTHLGIYNLSLLDESSHLFFLSRRFGFFFHSFCLEIHDHSRTRISLSGFICFCIVLLSVWGITVSVFCYYPSITYFPIPMSSREIFIFFSFLLLQGQFITQLGKTRQLPPRWLKCQLINALKQWRNNYWCGKSKNIKKGLPQVILFWPQKNYW